jgi:hypothetical protein
MMLPVSATRKIIEMNVLSIGLPSPEVATCQLYTILAVKY